MHIIQNNQVILVNYVFIDVHEVFFYWFIIFIAVQATVLQYSFRDLIKTGSAYLPEQSSVKGHFSHQSFF